MKNDYEVRGDTTVIFVKCKGETLECLISTVDLPKVTSFPNTWYALSSYYGTYVQGRYRTPDGKSKQVKLHRWILNPPEDKMVDHVDGNGLNNCRDNLRILK